MPVAGASKGNTRGGGAEAGFPDRRAAPAGGGRPGCLGHAGAGASAFRSWQPAVPGWIEICAVELPGRETRFGQPFATEVAPLVDEVVTALGSLPPLPVAVHGHSLGALLAFETARALRD